jgi:hypothetical protein
MVPEKSAEVTEPGRAAQPLPGSVTFLRLNKTFDNLPE